MSTANNMRRTSLFSRRFALSRRAAQSLPNGRTSIRQDSEGFDDLDEYFAASPAKPAADDLPRSNNNSSSKNWTITEDHPSSPPKTATRGGRPSSAYREIEMDIVPLDDDHDDDRADYSIGDNEAAFDYDENPVDYDVAEGHEADAIVLSPAHAEGENLAPPEDGENVVVEGDEEVSFKPSIKVVPSPTSLASAERRTRRTPRRPANHHKSAATPTERKSQTRATRAPRQPFTPLVDVTNHLYDGAGRRSKRQRIAPLAFWRNEKVVYGRRQSAKMPVIVDVLRTDAEKSPTKQASVRHGRRAASTRSRRIKSTSSSTERTLKAAGFREGVSVEAKVMDYDSHEQVERLIALGPDQVDAKPVKGENFSIQTIFTEGTFLSSGILEFPPDSFKPARNSSKHVLIFFVVEGVVEVTVHGTSFVAGTGCQFIIPRGNQYSIRSAESNLTSRLFFCHCKGSSSSSASD